jgi:NAD(P)-dependent dehydrogenase (short-subunit alcohol dehydrogenase family)
MRLGPREVRINALALGAISGGAGDPFAAGEVELLSHTAPRRPGTLQEVADAMLFLVDPENSCMTGHILPVDGGLIAGFARDF